jgi:hypothetical protein
MPTYNSALSAEVQATTTLPAPTLDTVTTDATSADLAWTATHTNGNTRVEYRDTDDVTWITDQTVGFATEAATISGLDNGTTYDFRVVATTADADSPSNTLRDTTVLPDEDQPILGNGIKDEIAVDRETAVTNTGDVRYQLRRSEDAPDWETAPSFMEFVGAFDTLTFEFTGLLDGEEYEVRGRTETDDVTGAWTTPVSIVTKFPGFQNFRIDSVGETSVTLAWEDFADNESGTRIERRAEVNGTFGPWEVIDTLAPTSGEGTTVTYDVPFPPDTTGQFRIEPFTPYTSVQSDAVEATTGGGGQNVAPEGYHVEVVNPATGRVRVPEVTDLQNAPVFNPGPNQQPTVRVPVRKNDVWLSDTYDDDPKMRVWRDGRRLPIEVLRDVEQLEGATVLVGVGGVELEQRVREEYDDDRRHLAVRDLVETETTYGDETPEPDTATLSDVVQQQADTKSELASVSSFGSDALVGIIGTTVTGRQVAYTREGAATDAESGTPQGLPGDVYSDGAARTLENTGDRLEYDITPDHDIPPGDFALYVRDGDGDEGQGTDGTVAYEWRFDGELVDEFPTSIVGNNSTFGWTDLTDSTENVSGVAYNSPALSAGVTYTLSVECTDGGGAGDQYTVDVVAPVDAREEDQLFFDDSVNSPGGYLDGPGFYVAQDAVFDNAASAFNVTGGSADITIDDTSGNQRLQISNDNGATWFPNDGTENNTTSVDVTYPQAGSGSRLRVTLDAYEPSGPQNATPRLNYASQELDAFTLRADISQELLLIEETFDTDLASILTAIAEPAERSWGLRTDANGDIVVRFVQNGQFDADYTPDYSDRTRDKLGKTYDSVTVKGSHEPESNIPYTASTSFEALPRENILSGSETVYDDTRNYDRGDDYEINYQTGEIRATAGGDLVVGDAYRVDFRYQARGRFESPDAPADPDELVTTVPGVTSQRLAEQVAFVLASEVDTPRYAAEVTIPDPDPRFDPTDALPPAALGLPGGIDSLEVRGQPQLTETGLRVRFGTRPPVEATQERLSRQLGRVSDRS